MFFKNLEIMNTNFSEQICESNSKICNWVYENTKSVTLAENLEMLGITTLKIFLTIIIALIAVKAINWVTDKYISRIIRRSIRPNEDKSKTGKNNQELAQNRVELRTKTLLGALHSINTTTIWVVTILVILGIMNVSLAPLFAGAGLIGIVIGFGAQTVVADFLSGFFMIIEDQFGVGDIINTGEVTGNVEKVSLRTTKLRDVNGTAWHIRNSEIKRVANKSQLWSRAVLDIEVDYETDIRKAQKVIEKAAHDMWKNQDENNADIIEPPEVWGVQQLDSNGVTIRLVAATKPAEQFRVARQLRLKIKEALEEANIKQPKHQQTVKFQQNE